MINDNDWEMLSTGSFCGWCEVSEWHLVDSESFDYGELIHFIMSNGESAQVYAFKLDGLVPLCSFKDGVPVYHSEAGKSIYDGCTMCKVLRRSDNNPLLPMWYTYVVTFPYSISEKL